MILENELKEDRIDLRIMNLLSGENEGKILEISEEVINKKRRKVEAFNLTTLGEDLANSYVGKFGRAPNSRFYERERAREFYNREKAKDLS